MPKRTPAAPATSWQGISAQRAEASSPPVGLDLDDHDDQGENTMVGEVPRNLLELSSSGDENTRAYTAPQELIELAKRKREERLQAKAAATALPMASTAVTQRPPARRRAEVGDSDYELARSGRRAPPSSDATPPRGTLAVTPPRGMPAVSPSDSPFDSDDAAPAVARSLSPEREPLAPASAPEIDISPVPPPTSALLALRRAVSEPLEPEESAPAVDDGGPSSELGSASQLMTPSQRGSSWFTGGRRWLMIAALCMLVGFVLSRWRGIEQLLLR
jgi:hypothetical protein